MEYFELPACQLRLPRIALGTWAIGGWMWGGTEEQRSIDTIHRALEKGVTLIDTAPVYGFGASEKTVGKAIEARGRRDDVLLSTKVGLEWTEAGDIRRNSSRDRIFRELDDSLKRLRTDYIDIYHVHWPDPACPIPETARAMRELCEQGVVRAVGVSNFTRDQMERFSSECPLHICQPPYNIFERAIDTDVKPYCEQRGIAIMAYGALCRGMLSGRMSREREFPGDDLRNMDPKFQAPRFTDYLAAADAIQSLARERYGKTLAAFSVRWILERGVPVAIWGARSPEQLGPLDDMLGWSMDLATLAAVDSLLAEHVTQPVGPEFMAPPTGMEK